MSFPKAAYVRLSKRRKALFTGDSRFHLPCKKALRSEENQFDAVQVDVMESLVERLKKQRLNYSGKKKRHTQKTQIVADKASRKILCTDFDRGGRHDFKLFKNSRTYLTNIYNVWLIPVIREYKSCIVTAKFQRKRAERIR
jgi:hypothetical protein